MILEDQFKEMRENPVVLLEVYPVFEIGRLILLNNKKKKS